MNLGKPKLPAKQTVSMVTPCSIDDVQTLEKTTITVSHHFILWLWGKQVKNYLRTLQILL